MWGKLNQMVSGDQQKIMNLEEQLEHEQSRNKLLNDQYKKLLKEKEVKKIIIKLFLYIPVTVCQPALFNE